jgi:hypothetical protein
MIIYIVTTIIIDFCVLVVDIINSGCAKGRGAGRRRGGVGGVEVVVLSIQKFFRPLVSRVQDEGWGKGMKGVEGKRRTVGGRKGVCCVGGGEVMREPSALTTRCSLRPSSPSCSWAPGSSC